MHALEMAINNPQTWSRLTRSRMRQLANLIGNEVMRSMAKWPQSGEGRSIKAATESISRRLDGQQPLRDLQRAFDELISSANDFQSILNNPYFRGGLGLSTVKRANSREVDTFSSVIEGLINETQVYIQSYLKSLPPPPTPAEIAALEVAELVPEQKTGPLRFALVDGVVRVDHQSATPAARDLQNVNAARQELVAQGRAGAEYLRTANFDPRLTEEVLGIVARLEAVQDVIALGVAAISFQQVVDSFKEELPDFWSAKLQGFALSLSMYVAQFPEWMRFAENAADAEYSSDDVTRLYVAGHNLTEQLKVEGQLVDPEVPRSLAFLLESVRDPRRAVKRTVFAAIRSIENLISVVVKAFGTIVSGTAEGAKKGVSSATTIIVGSTLLYAAANAAVHIDPAAGRVLRTSWLGKAGKLILDNMKKE